MNMFFRVSVCLRIGIFMLLITENFSYENFDFDHFQSQGKNEKIGNGNHKENHRDFPEDCSVCGITHSSDENSKEISKRSYSMVYFGDRVKPYYRYPWMAAVMDMNTNRRICAAAILNANYIITAAHCFETPGIVEKSSLNNCIDKFRRQIPCFRNPSTLRIAVLTSKRRRYRRYPIEKIIPHPDFNHNTTLIHDICIAKLQQPIKCNKYHSPICLPPATYQFRHQLEYTIAGWGVYSPNSAPSKDLREAKLKITSPARCMSKMRESRPFKFNHTEYDFFYCMYGMRNRTPCKGDSGSSIFGPIGDKMYAIAILSSLTYEFCDPERPVLLMSIPGHMSWISKVIGKVPTKSQGRPISPKCPNNPTRPMSKEYERKERCKSNRRKKCSRSEMGSLCNQRRNDD